MNEKMIIPQGERAKYFVKSEKWNFSFEENNYRLELLYGMAGKKIVIPKSEFQYLSNRWLFSFPTNDMIGPVKARLVMDIIDPDCPEGVRVEVDEQIIGFVVSASCPRFMKCPKCCGGTGEIIYERTEESDIGEQWAFLCDKDGVRFETSDGGYILCKRNI